MPAEGVRARPIKLETLDRHVIGRNRGQTRRLDDEFKRWEHGKKNTEALTTFEKRCFLNEYRRNQRVCLFVEGKRIHQVGYRNYREKPVQFGTEPARFRTHIEEFREMNDRFQRKPIRPSSKELAKAHQERQVIEVKIYDFCAKLEKLTRKPDLQRSSTNLHPILSSIPVIQPLFRSITIV